MILPPKNVLLGVLLTVALLVGAFLLRLPEGGPRFAVAGLALLTFGVPAFGPWLRTKRRRR